MVSENVHVIRTDATALVSHHCEIDSCFLFSAVIFYQRHEKKYLLIAAI